jgi:ABC-type antimicrobial peptide transport system permease subunit
MITIPLLIIAVLAYLSGIFATIWLVGYKSAQLKIKCAEVKKRQSEVQAYSTEWRKIDHEVDDIESDIGFLKIVLALSPIWPTYLIIIIPVAIVVAIVVGIILGPVRGLTVIYNAGSRRGTAIQKRKESVSLEKKESVTV